MINNNEKVSLLFDEGFPDRVLKMSLYLSLIAITYSLSYMSFTLTLSIAIGSFASLISCRVLWWTIQHGLRHEKTEIKKFFLKVSILKYSVVGGILFFICVFLEINTIAMAVGLGIVVAVIVMKVGSKLLVDFMNKSVKVSEKGV
ncbi:MAG: hypothetical protein HRF42_03145 [Candidatus Brocadia sp.]|jgi:hypothetical protein